MKANTTAITINGVPGKIAVETISLMSAMIRPVRYKYMSGYKKARGVPSQRPSWAGNHSTKVNPGFRCLKAV
ncbi:hypothetical protein D3C76_1685300 [compost metagenome]